MTKLETLHGQIAKEKRRIEMLKNTVSNGDACWYDFINKETKEAKRKINVFQRQFDKEYIYQNS